MNYLTYTTDALNRQAELRSDVDWLKRILETPGVLIWLIWRNKPLIDLARMKVPSITPEAAREYIARAATYVAAGDLDGKPVLVLDISAENLDPENTEPGGSFTELRPFVSGLEAETASLLAYARSLFVWHRSSRFCGKCGFATWPREHGHSRKCENADCGIPHFPRLNPAVIMLVTAADQALLARNVDFPEGLQSVLAGYVEHGESLEQAVAREVMEEVGLEIDRVSYISSQPWPYTNSLMFGFHAEIDGHVLPEITIDEVEISEARWWGREALLEAADKGELILPSTDAIARQLLDRWLLAK